MKKIVAVAILILALILGQAVAKSTADGLKSGSGEMFKLIGAMVWTPQGEYLGGIAEVVTGPEGHVAFAILGYEVAPDTQRRIAVPFGALSCEEQNCLLNSSKEALDSAPAFASNDNLAEPKLAEDIYRYFGVQPYWTEEEREK